MAKSDKPGDQRGGTPEQVTVPLGPGRKRSPAARPEEDPAPDPAAASPVTTSAGPETAVPEMEGRYLPVDPQTGAPIEAGESEELARGGMGRVICVLDRSTAREVVLKERLLEDSAGASVDFSASDARFLQEARVTAQLEHPSIIPIYEIGRRASGRLYYTMRRVQGKTLADCLDECETLAERLEYLPHFQDLCNAIAFAHDKGVIHRDIKSENVMVGQFGETVVLDWGLAKVRGASAAAEHTALQEVASFTQDLAQSMQGHAIGTPSYLSPEQARGELELIDERSDVYSLGVVLYELLTGERPFEGDSSEEIIRQVIEREPKPVRARVRRAPKELATIAACAMQKDRALRYSDAGELAMALGHYLAGTFVPPPRGWTRAWLAYLWREKRVHLGWATVMIVVVALALMWQLDVTRERLSERQGYVAMLDKLQIRFEKTRTEQSRLSAALAAQEAERHRGTLRGLAAAARAVLLDGRQQHHALLYREAMVHPYTTPDWSAPVGQGCAFATVPPARSGEVWLLCRRRFGEEGDAFSRPILLSVDAVEAGAPRDLALSEEALAQVAAGIGAAQRSVGGPALLARLGEPVVTLRVSADGQRAAAISASGALRELRRDRDDGWQSGPLLHVGPADDLHYSHGALWIAGRDGILRRHRALEPALRSIDGAVLAIRGEVLGFNYQGWALELRDGVVRLLRPKSAGGDRSLPLQRPVAVAFTSDGGGVLAIERADEGMQLAYLGDLSELATVARWPAPLEASAMWPLAIGGRHLLAVADAAGRVAVVDYMQKTSLGEPGCAVRQR